MSDIQAVDQAEALIAMERDFGGRLIFAKTVRQCHTCMSEFRPFIEEQYLMGTPARSIIEMLTVDGHDVGITVGAMHEHFRRGHCTIPAALRQLKIWNKAAELGVDPQTYNEVGDTSMDILRLAVDHIKNEFKAGHFEWDSKDMLAILKMLREMEKDERADSGFSGTSDDIFIAVSILMQHVSVVFARFLPMQQEEARAYFKNLVDADPILKEIIERTREIVPESEDFNGDEDSDIVDGEIVTIRPHSTMEVAQVSETVYDSPLADSSRDWDQEEPWS